MILVDVLLAANLAVLAVLVVADRSRSHRARPVEVLAATRLSPREAVKPRKPAPGPDPGCGGVVIPFDRAARRGVASSMARHPAGGRLRNSR